VLDMFRLRLGSLLRLRRAQNNWQSLDEEPEKLLKDYAT
jgi:hypothetical protein